MYKYSSWPNGVKGIQFLRLLSKSLTSEKPDDEMCLLEDWARSWIRNNLEQNANTSMIIDCKLIQDVLASNCDRELFLVFHEALHKQVGLYTIEKIGEVVLRLFRDTLWFDTTASVGNEVEMRALKVYFTHEDSCNEISTGHIQHLSRRD